jgi:lipopolysaccharide biosynthesis glycosyltransferase
MSEGTLHVCCAAEGGYVVHAAAMLDSVLFHSDERTVHVHFLHGPGLSLADTRLLRRVVDAGGGRLSCHEVSESALEGLPSMSQFTPAMWYRIFLPELLPGVDRVLYLDADTIVAESLGPLWQLDLEDNYLAAVTNLFQHNHVQRPAELGLAGPEVYFNSGVLLMNLERMRRDSCSAALADYARVHAHELEWPDQDALNVVLGGRRLPLHPRWNCMNSMFAFRSARRVFGRRALREALARPAIRHFEGPAENKPWHPDCRAPLRELYTRHRVRLSSSVLDRDPAGVVDAAQQHRRGAGGEELVDGATGAFPVPVVVDDQDSAVG